MRRMNYISVMQSGKYEHRYQKGKSKNLKENENAYIVTMNTVQILVKTKSTNRIINVLSV